MNLFRLLSHQRNFGRFKKPIWDTKLPNSALIFAYGPFAIVTLPVSVSYQLVVLKKLAI